MIRQIYKQVLLKPTRQTSLLQCACVRYCSTQKPSDVTDSEAEDTELETVAASREASFCDVTVLGRLGTAPKQIQVPNGSDFVTFVIGTLAGSTTKWHEVNVNKPATKRWLLESVGVGDRLFIKGKLSYRQEPNAKLYRISAEEVKMINRSKKNLEKLGHKEDE